MGNIINEGHCLSPVHHWRDGSRARAALPEVRVWFLAKSKCSMHFQWKRLLMFFWVWKILWFHWKMNELSKILNLFQTLAEGQQQRCLFDFYLQTLKLTTAAAKETEPSIAACSLRTCRCPLGTPTQIKQVLEYTAERNSRRNRLITKSFKE